MEIHVRIGSQNYGPFDLQQVKDMQATGQLREDDPAWCTGMEDWTTLERVLARCDPAPAPPAAKQAPKQSLSEPESQKPAEPTHETCAKCGTALPVGETWCHRCGHQSGARASGGRHQRHLEGFREEMQRKDMLTRVGGALLAAGLLPALVGSAANPDLTFPNFQLAGLSGAQAFLLLSPSIAGLLLLLAGIFVPAPLRAMVAVVLAGFVIFPIATVRGAGLPGSLDFLNNIGVLTAAGIPPPWLMMALGWTCLLGGSRWRSFVPGSLAAYIVTAAGGVLLVLGWVVPGGQGGGLFASVFELFNNRIVMAVSLSLVMLCHAGAVGFCVLSTGGKATMSIVNMNRYAMYLLVASVILPAVVFVVMAVGETLQGGGPRLNMAMSVIRQMLTEVKMGLWLGGAALLAPFALADMCAWRAAEDKPTRRPNPAGLPTVEN
ncbi:MAG: hypothetical protein CMO66_00545 [Verrucomicrobiales bacterium]|nr:hypothetical protein [Verrucomicrobiales bacterium]